MNNPLIFCGLVALFWGTMPLVSRASGLESGWVAIVLSLGTLAVTLFRVNSSLPAAGPLAICFLAGILNGLGMLAFGVLASWHGVDMSRLVSVAFALIPVVATIGACVGFGESITISKLAGLGTIAIGIYLLR